MKIKKFFAIFVYICFFTALFAEDLTARFIATQAEKKDSVEESVE